jgi:hypothetical protein
MEFMWRPSIEIPYAILTIHYWFDLEHSKATKACITESETRYYDLTDGQKIFDQLSQKQSKAEEQILLLRKPNWKL